MGKGLKKFFITISVIVGVVGVAALTGIILISDDERGGLKRSDDGANVQQAIAGDLSTSLDNIVGTSYADNKIRFDFTPVELNNYLIEGIRTKFPEYLISQDYIMGSGGFKLNSIYFDAYADSLQLFGCFSYNSLHTAIRLSSAVRIDDGNKLVVDFKEIKFGKYIKVAPSHLNGIIEAFRVNKTALKGFGLDLDEMKYSIDIRDIIRTQISDKLAKELFANLHYNAAIIDGTVVMSVDTKTVFTGHREAPAFDTSALAGKVSTAISQVGLTGSADLVLSSDEFNYLAHDDINKSMPASASTFTYGGITFPFSVSNPMYNIAEARVETSFKLKDVESTAAFIADIDPVYDADSLQKLEISAVFAGVGDFTFGGSDGFKFDFTVEADSLKLGLPSTFKISHFETDKEHSTVTISLFA